MAVNSKHPQYSSFYDLWQQMTDTYRGAQHVKAAGEKYLPKTSGMVNDKQTGQKRYDAYKARAHFPDFVNDAIDGALGVMHRKPAVIEVPEAMEAVLHRATPRGESAQLLLEKITERQMVEGRLGLLVDLPAQATLGEVQPYIALYTAQAVLNWDAGERDQLGAEALNFVALDESSYERLVDFDWEFVTKTRILMLGDALANEPTGRYAFAVYRDDGSSTFSENDLEEVSLRGNTLDLIPFTFINSKDLVTECDEPPLLGLAELALTVYRGEADYRQNLFMQAQDTLVTIGANVDDDGNVEVGSTSAIHVPVGGDAKFIGVSATGLPEQRQALENDRKAAAQKGAQLLEVGGGDRESGEALKTRVSASTATLTQIAKVAAAGLEQALRHTAMLMGLNPEDVSVEPNLEFADDPLTGDLLVKYMQAKALGLPISLESIHSILMKKDLTELDYAEELAKIIAEEEEALARMPEPLGGNLDDQTGNDPEPEDGE